MRGMRFVIQKGKDFLEDINQNKPWIEKWTKNRYNKYLFFVRENAEKIANFLADDGIKVIPVVIRHDPIEPEDRDYHYENRYKNRLHPNRRICA